LCISKFNYLSCKVEIFFLSIKCWGSLQESSIDDLKDPYKAAFERCNIMCTTIKLILFSWNFCLFLFSSEGKKKKNELVQKNSAKKKHRPILSRVQKSRCIWLVNQSHYQIHFFIPFYFRFIIYNCTMRICDNIIYVIY